MPTQAATASAAGASTTVSEGVKDPRSPRDAAKARPHDPSAMTHRRAAQASRVPRARRSGSAAATTSSQAIGERAAGPTAKRMTSPQFGAVAPETGRPKMATDPFPASTVPITQGSARASATATACNATTRTRHVGSRAPDEDGPHHPGHRGDEDHGDDRGREAAAAAMTAPRTATCPAGRLRQRGPGATAYGATPAARARRSAMNGKAA